MKKETVRDIIEWDIHNWSQALSFWEKYLSREEESLHCLELGGRRGGLSLWLALKGHTVICSDLTQPGAEAEQLHRERNMEEKISYQAIDATNIPYENHFDLIVFKSILGGIGRNGNTALQKKTLNQVYRSLKPGGKLLFAENLQASSLHKFMRKKFVKWGGEWNYLSYTELEGLFLSFERIHFKTSGFFGAFGRSEWQRNLLGRFDSLIRFFTPKGKRYIVFGVAEKAHQ